MNAVLKPQRRLEAMRPGDLAAVLAIEGAAYEFPWTRGNFLDSLHAGYLARLLYDEQGTLAGYFVAMAGVDEMHLLNLSVAPALQGLGHARCMLDSLREHCRTHAAAMLWLEVRNGNLRARELYKRYGFIEIGVRRNYYPAAAAAREDAIVMSLVIDRGVAPVDRTRLMVWTERQRRMLVELGLPPWLSPASDVDDDPTVASLPPVEAADAVPERVAAPLSPRVVQQPATASTTATPDPVTAAPAHADMGWDELRRTVESCTACGLCEGRTRTVFGVGHPSAHWMVVGEAPGEQEDRQGEPFVGRSGQLLDNMLAALGLTRDDATADRQVFIANTLKCRPPGNRNPTPEELATCEPFLIRQVALVQPRIILAMGRFAVQSLLRSSEPIGRLRGKVHRYQGVPLVVTYHPAYLLRNPLEKARAWDDLCLAASTLAASAESSVVVRAPD